MNWLKHLLFLLLLLCFTISTKAFAQETKKIYYFQGEGCPHCAKVEEYFNNHDFFDKYPIDTREIYFNRENAVLYNQVMDDLGIPNNARGVPTVVIGEKVLIGDKPIIANFVGEANNYLGITAQPDESISLDNTPALVPNSPNPNLTLAAVAGASIVDAINPCAFAVLIILMTTILATGDSKKALKSGFAFSGAIFISYFLMGLGLYKVLGVGELSLIFYKVIGWLAIILGLLNLKDYFWYGKGVLMEVPRAWRPKMKNLIMSVTNPIGAFGVGFLVSLFLLPCTSGPYIVILGMLAKNAVQTNALLYLILYNLIFISPMILISLAVYKGFNPAKAEEMRQKRLKTLHLIAGIIMLIMGVVIVGGWL